MLNSLWFVDQQPCGIGRSAESWATLWPTEMDYLGMEPRDLIKCCRWCFCPYSARARFVRGASVHMCSRRSVPRSDRVFQCLTILPAQGPAGFYCWPPHTPFKAADTQQTRSPSPDVCLLLTALLSSPVSPSSTIWALYILQLSLKTFFQVNTHTPDAPELTV